MNNNYLKDFSKSLDIYYNQDDQGNLIHPTAVISKNVILGKNNIIGPYCVIGYPGAIRDNTIRNGKVIIGNNNNIMNFVTMMIGYEGDTLVGNNNIIMNYVNIGHNVTIKDNNEIGVASILGGHCVINNNIKIKIQCNIRTFVNIGDNSLIGMGSNVVKNVPSYTMVKGNPAKEYTK